MKADPPGHLQPPAPTDTSVALAARLRAHTRGEVLFDAAARGRYATDASIYQVMPVGVFVPTDDADVRTAIQIARELTVPLLPRGAGTSQCGQTVGACLVIVGPVVKIDPASLPRRPNLHYLGGKTYDELPAYLAGWDVCLLPFALNEATRYISPTKTLEYMAAAKPVVSTATASSVTSRPTAVRTSRTSSRA